MIIKNTETWGQLLYDTNEHKFCLSTNRDTELIPYITRPIVLNCDLTFECNMDCLYCVAKDMKNFEHEDLSVNKDLINKINISRFMVIVITGANLSCPNMKKNC